METGDRVRYVWQGRPQGMEGTVIDSYDLKGTSGVWYLYVRVQWDAGWWSEYRADKSLELIDAGEQLHEDVR